MRVGKSAGETSMLLAHMKDGRKARDRSLELSASVSGA